MCWACDEADDLRRGRVRNIATRQSGLDIVLKEPGLERDSPVKLIARALGDPFPPPEVYR
jgi:hypothetical protein